jgi:hypothetical protein
VRYRPFPSGEFASAACRCRNPVGVARRIGLRYSGNASARVRAAYQGDCGTGARVKYANHLPLYRQARSSAGHQSRSLDLGRLGRPRRLAADRFRSACSRCSKARPSCSPMRRPVFARTDVKSFQTDRTFRRLRHKPSESVLSKFLPRYAEHASPNVRMKLIEALGRLGAPGGARRGPCRHQTSALVQKGARRSLVKSAKTLKVRLTWIAFETELHATKMRIVGFGVQTDVH